MDTREPRHPNRVVLMSDNGKTPPFNRYDWSRPKTLDSGRVRSFAVEDVRRLIAARGVYIGQDGPEGAALLAALEAYAARGG